MSTESKAAIDQMKEKYGEDKTGKILSYIDMVLERNEHINLTAVRDRDDAVVKHAADSLVITGLPEYRSAKTVIDVGTGAGFPGALLAAVSPEKEFVLLDSTLKRLRVIDEFAQVLGLSNIRTVHARAEEINRKPEYNGAFDLCVSRAVADLEKLSGWCLPFVRRGGAFVSYKGESYASEIEAAKRVLSRNDAAVSRIVGYDDMPSSISGHVLIVISKQ